MRVQSINNDNNSSFKAIAGIEYKGKFFSENPELIQPILERIVPDKRYNFPGKSVRVVAKSTDYADFLLECCMA